MADPVSPAAGQNIDKTFWDAEVYARWVDLYAPWVSYTPAWTTDSTAPTLGNGTLTGKYKQVGKTVFFYARLTYGSTSSTPAGSPWYLSLPVLPSVNSVASARGGNANGSIPLTAILLTTGRTWFTRHDGTAVSSSVPATWASGFILTASGVYEAA